jgi:hypothetical protein
MEWNEDVRAARLVCNVCIKETIIGDERGRKRRGHAGYSHLLKDVIPARKIHMLFSLIEPTVADALTRARTPDF